MSLEVSQFFTPLLIILIAVYFCNKKRIENTAILSLWKIDRKIQVLLFASFLLTPPLLLLELWVYLSFLGFRECVGVYLKWKYPKKFGGFLKNTDAVWGIDYPSKGYMFKYLVVKSNDEFSVFLEKVRKRVKEKYFSGKNIKLEATWHKFLGYIYILNNDCTVDDCLTVFECEEETIDDKILQKVMSDVAHVPLPKNHTTFWNIYVLNKPFKWTEKDNEPKFAIILKVHHITCDGIGCQKLLVGFSDFEKPPENSDDENETHQNSFGDTIRKYYYHFGYILAFNTIGLLDVFRKNSTKLKNVKPSPKKFCVSTREHQPEYFSKIKHIRRALNATFSDVILWAISKSFTENFYKDEPKPEFVSYAITSLPYLKKFPVQHHGKKDLDVFNNDMISMSCVLLPGKFEDESYIGSFRSTQKYFDLLKNSYKQEFGLWFSRFAGTCIPNILYDWIFWNLQDVIVTNLPGDRPLKLFDGCQLEESVGYAPNHFRNGFTFTINTYGNRMQNAMVVDRTLVDDLDEARKYTDGIFKQIDHLHQEVLMAEKTQLLK